MQPLHKGSPIVGQFARFPVPLLTLQLIAVWLLEGTQLSALKAALQPFLSVVFVGKLKALRMLKLVVSRSVLTPLTTLAAAVSRLVKLAVIWALRVTGSNLLNYMIISDKLFRPSDATPFDVKVEIRSPSPKGMQASILVRVLASR